MSSLSGFCACPLLPPRIPAPRHVLFLPSDKAPVTKVLLVGCVVGTGLLLSAKRPDSLTLNHQVLAELQVWRLATSQLFFSSFGEALAAAALLYWFRVFERLMGSAKFAGFVFVNAVMASTLQLGLLVSFPSIERIAPGPYPLIFSLFVVYYAKVPKAVPSYFRLLGLGISDKTVTYLVGLQLLFSGGAPSIAAGLSGVLCGTLYGSGMLSLSNFRFPAPLRNLSQRLILPVVESESPQEYEARRRAAQQRQEAAATMDAQAQFQAQLQAALRSSLGAGAGGVPVGPPEGGMPAFLPGAVPVTRVPLPVAPTPPNPEAVERLTAMGFSAAEVQRALVLTNNNEERAADLLLSQ